MYSFERIMTFRSKYMVGNSRSSQEHNRHNDKNMS